MILLLEEGILLLIKELLVLIWDGLKSDGFIDDCLLILLVVILLLLLLVVVVFWSN